jgi:propanol-preferring alcohol dehydrogenase
LTGLRNGHSLGLAGFGASAHLVLQIANNTYPNSTISVFTRSEEERTFARELGAVWVGDIDDECPEKLDCIIDTTSVWKPVVEALRNLAPGGRLVINTIRKEDVDKEYLTRMNYITDFWMEKEIKSVANVTRRDVEEFLQVAVNLPIKPEIQQFSLEGANRALAELKKRIIRGAKVLQID